MSHLPRVDQPLVAVPLAVAAGACFALSAALQQQVARGVAPTGTRALVGRLLRERRWVAGVLTGWGSYVLQAFALAFGPLALVQPLIVTDLVFAIPVAAWLRRLRPGGRELTGAVLVAVGLAGMLAASRPQGGIDDPSRLAWAATVGGVCVLVAVALVAVRATSSTTRTSFAALAAGLTFGLMSVLTKTVAAEIEGRGLAAAARWQPWALALVSVAGLTLAQQAYQAGPLAVSLPVIDVVEPVTAVVVGLTAFQERISVGPAVLAVAVLGVVAVLVGVLLIDRAPRVLSAQHAGQVPAPAPGGRAVSEPSG